MGGLVIKGFLWVRPFMPERWVDGDTVHGLIDRGDGDLYRPIKGLRALFADGSRFDTPEKAERDRCEAARISALQLMPPGVPVVSTSHELDVYGRPLCSFQLPDGRDFATVMAEMGHLK